MRRYLQMRAIAALLLGGSAFAVAGVGSQAQAATYDLGDGFSLGIIDAGNPSNPPVPPDNLICFAGAGTCNAQDGPNFVQSPDYTGDEDIDSVGLWKSDSDTATDGFSNDIAADGLSGTWTQVWQGVVGELIAHYAAIKSSTYYHLIGYDLSLITAALVAGDTITGNWVVGKNQEISHLNLYNTEPAPIPLPAAGFLLIGALGGLGGLSMFRRRRREGETA